MGYLDVPYPVLRLNTENLNLKIGVQALAVTSLWHWATSVHMTFVISRVYVLTVKSSSGNG
jgi:hypothetical protein